MATEQQAMAAKGLCLDRYRQHGAHAVSVMRASQQDEDSYFLMVLVDPAATVPAAGEFFNGVPVRFTKAEQFSL